MDKQLLLKTFRNTFGAALYIFLVSQLMQNGSKLFGETDSTLTPFFMLLLFSLSAAVVGGLVLGFPVLLFFDGKKNDSIKAAIYSVGWLFVFLVIVLVLMLLMK
ncbi:MAG: hypothetical protein PHW75_02180 [Patescibacteria group bacterium]|nr:hypothetical protein [Patescibacteria group bacterium]